MAEQLRIGPVRFSYVSLLKTKLNKQSNTETYSAQLLIPKSDTKTIAEIKAAIERLKEEFKAVYKGKLPTGFKNPLKDGDALNDDGERIYGEEAEGFYLMNANAKKDNKPGLLVRKNGSNTPDYDESEIYSGMWGYAQISLFKFDLDTSKGIGVGLNNVLKTRDDKRFDGRQSAEQAFSGMDIIDEDEL